jgi:aldoxime dehydratase
VRPALLEGMNFLRDHPDETGCCDLRFAEETDGNGVPLQKTFGLGYFLTLGHLEKWASTHPTHLTIFSRFVIMVRQHRADLKLKLWHEVSVLPAAGQVFEYINCHPGTGLLPYFPYQEC